MGNPLANRTVTVPAGSTGERLHMAGRYVKIVSCTVASVLMGFDDSSPERVYPDDCYAGPAEGFQGLRFVADVGACTVVVQVSQEPILGGASSLLGELQAIRAHIDGGAAADPAGQLADTVCPVTPGPGLLLFAANANRTEVEITASPGNGAGVVYLGITAARSIAADKFIELAAGDIWYSEREKGAIFATSSTGAEVVNGREC